MIDSGVYKKILDEATKRDCEKGVCATALEIFVSDYQTIKKDNPEMKAAELKKLMMVPTTITNIVSQAEKNFQEHAKRQVRKLGYKKTSGQFAYAVFSGVVSNIAFVLLMIILYFVVPFVAPDVISGFEVEAGPESEAKKLGEGEEKS